MSAGCWSLCLFVSAAFTAYVVWIYPYIVRFLAGPSQKSPPSSNPLPFVTIVTACYNESANVERKVNDLFTTDYPADRMTVLFVDNESTDDTKARLDALANKFPIRVIGSPRGKISALNAALPAAQGDIVVSTDCDAWWEPGSLRALIGAFCDPSVGAACALPVIHGPLYPSKARYHAADFEVRRLEGELDACTVLDGRLMAFRRNALERFDESLGIDDMGLSLSLRRKGLRSVVVPGAFIHENCQATAAGEFAQIRRHVHSVIVCLWGGREVLFNPRFGFYGLVAMPSHCLMPVFLPLIFMLMGLSLWNISPFVAMAAAVLSAGITIFVDPFPALQAAAIAAAWGDFLGGRRADVWSR